MITESDCAIALRPDGGAGFSVETVRRLRRHKFPFAGALKAVIVDDVHLSATDPKYVKLAQSRRDQLDRRFEAIKGRLAELLPQYVEFVARKGKKDSEGLANQTVCIAVFPIG